MGGFTTGFLSAVGDAAKKRADQRKAQLDAEKAAQAEIYHQVIKNPQSTAEQVTYAQAQLGKLYPKDPQIKQIFDKVHGLINQVHPGHQQDQGQPSENQGPMPPPPQPSAESMEGAPKDTAAPTATGTIATPPFNPNAKGGIPAPPQPAQSAAPKGQDPRFPEMAKVAAGPTMAEQDQRALDLFKKQHQILHDFRMAELQEAAKAKAANPTGRATAISPISMSEARKMAENGQVFPSADGQQPLVLDDYDDTMMLVPLQQNGRIVGYSPASQKQSHLTFNNQVIAVPSLNQMDANTKGTTLGQSQVGSTTKTFDPATGQTTTAVRTPNVPKAAGGAAPTGTTQAPNAPATTPPVKSPPIAKSGGGTSTKQVVQAPLSTDPDGGIPDSTTRFNGLPISPQVREGANQLLKSERDVKDLPSKTKELSASLARAYGWDQNAFTPLERRQIGVASQFIDNLLTNPNLTVLDQDFWDQLPMIGATGDVGKESFIGKLGTKLASRSLSDEQADFLRDYRQLASVISGLGKLSRGGRVTESTVNRLLSDLPNPSNTKDSADAKRRLMLLKQEINTALDNGTFEQLTKAKRKSSISTPPKPSDVSTGQLSQAAKDYLKSQNIPVE